LLGGTNDMELLARSQVGRDINRHYYSAEEVTAALEKPMVKKLIAMMRLRNTHPGFGGAETVESANAQQISIIWRSGGDWVKLDVDLAKPYAAIEGSSMEPIHIG